MNTFIALSGGVDSTALALLETEAQLVFTDTGWEFPHVYEHLDKIERVTGRTITRVNHPDWPGGLPEYIRHYAYLPGHGSRFCTRVFKIEAYNLYIKSHLPATLMIGLRADEPEEDRPGNLTELNGLTIRYPLRERGIGRVDTVSLCAKYDLVPRAEPYAARGGCMGCYFKRTAEVKALIQMRPEVVDQLQELEEEIQAERGRFAYMFPNVGKSIRQLRSEMACGTQLTMDEIYQQAADRTQMRTCGLFCNR